MRCRIDVVWDIGKDKYPLPSNIGRVMSVSGNNRFCYSENTLYNRTMSNDE